MSRSVSQSTTFLPSRGQASRYGFLSFPKLWSPMTPPSISTCFVRRHQHRMSSIIFGFRSVSFQHASTISGFARIRRCSPCGYLRSRKHSFEKCVVREGSSFGDSNTAAVGHNKTLQPQSAANQRMHPTSATEPQALLRSPLAPKTSHCIW